MPLVTCYFFILLLLVIRVSGVVEVGATADWVYRWNAPGIGYKHQGFVKMYILFFSDRLRCKMTDGELKMRFPDPEDRHRYKDQDRSSGRLEMRLFELLVDHGEREVGGFLNKGKGNEGLANDSDRVGINYLVVLEPGAAEHPPRAISMPPPAMAEMAEMANRHHVAEMAKGMGKPTESTKGVCAYEGYAPCSRATGPKVGNWLAPTSNQSIIQQAELSSQELEAMIE